jgi:hypothetical protein
MATVECWVDDQQGKTPAPWMTLVADRLIGSQYTLNGTIYSFGIQSPICEGDNLEFDGVVFHIESVNHNFSINPNGVKSWTTVLTLTNGMRADANVKFIEQGAFPDDLIRITQFPIYPGFAEGDFTGNDPGLTLEQVATTGGPSNPKGLVDDPTKTGDPNNTVTPLSAGTGLAVSNDPTEPFRFGGDFDAKPEF